MPASTSTSEKEKEKEKEDRPILAYALDSLLKNTQNGVCVLQTVPPASLDAALSRYVQSGGQVYRVRGSLLNRNYQLPADMSPDSLIVFEQVNAVLDAAALHRVLQLAQASWDSTRDGRRFRVFVQASEEVAMQLLELDGYVKIFPGMTTWRLTRAHQKFMEQVRASTTGTFIPE